MVHELLGLNDNRVVLKGAPGVRKDLEEVSFNLKLYSVVPQGVAPYRNTSPNRVRCQRCFHDVPTLLEMWHLRWVFVPPYFARVCRLCKCTGGAFMYAGRLLRA